MELKNANKGIIDQLQKEILLLQGLRAKDCQASNSFSLASIESAFPNSVFPTGAIHEFVNVIPEHAAASGGFIAGLLNFLMVNGGACLWISASRTLFPPALKLFGVEPDRIIFIDLKEQKDVLWAMEEALKCEGLAAVIGEVSDINLTQSRRLQLTVEKSKVTGLILRNNKQKLATTACVARWQIKPIVSELEEGMPGVGFPRWNVELLKVKNGNPGSWEIEWSAGRFNLVQYPEVVLEKLQVG
ncbi:MAG TPA: Error-prone repair protein ImuA [Pedobacter sp.]